MPNLFDEHDENRHMPFIFEGNKLLFCQASIVNDYFELQGALSRRPREGVSPYRAYRVCVADLDLENNSISNVTELDCCQYKNIYCSPNAYRDEDGNINLIYVQENIMSGGKHFYRAYRRIGKDFDSLGEPIHIKPILGVRNYCYTENNNYKVVASSYVNNVYIMVYDKEEKKTLKISLGNCGFLRRVSLVSESNNLLLTYPQAGVDAHNSCGLHLTEMLNLDNLEVSKIHAEDRCLYKSSVFGGKIIYSHRDTSQEKYCMDLKISEYTTSSGKIMPQIQQIWDF